MSLKLTKQCRNSYREWAPTSSADNECATGILANIDYVQQQFGITRLHAVEAFGVIGDELRARSTH
jgi:hypothetical protein